MLKVKRNSDYIVSKITSHWARTVQMREESESGILFSLAAAWRNKDVYKKVRRGVI